MARVRVFHWKEAEAGPLFQTLRSAKHKIDYDEKVSPAIFQAIRLSPPAAIVIDLSRLPSHGREVAVFLRGNKITRSIPIVFVDGLPEKVETVRQTLPDAVYTSLDKLNATLGKHMGRPLADPLAPKQMMDRYAARTAAQKLGIAAGSSVALIDPPRNYSEVIGALPENVAIQEDADEERSVTLWFVHNPEDYLAGLRAMRAVAARSKLWILWRKKSAIEHSPLSETFIRESAIDVGLVDYKICSVNAVWSALAFAKKKVSF